MDGKDKIILEICELLVEQDNLRVRRDVDEYPCISAAIKYLPGYQASIDFRKPPSLPFRSALLAIRHDLVDDQKIGLVNAVNEFFEGIEVTNASSVMAELHKNNALKCAILYGIRSFLMKDGFYVS